MLKERWTANSVGVSFHLPSHVFISHLSTGLTLMSSKRSVHQTSYWILLFLTPWCFHDTLLYSDLDVDPSLLFVTSFCFWLWCWPRNLDSCRLCCDESWCWPSEPCCMLRAISFSSSFVIYDLQVNFLLSFSLMLFHLETQELTKSILPKPGSQSSLEVWDILSFT